ncbi:hypothetical protein [Amycolatopsis sp. NPDC021455]|uniref:hypothetical protein n=1 Tax=Amycolatopsis sp. NPDC021455 TaxID=3154901 RepID=UPI0033C13D86
MRLADGQVVARRFLALGPQMQARTQGLEGVAGNATDPVAQVGASAAAGALAAADINRMPAIADTDAALQGIAA